ncbi:MAG: hypothetical protein SZ59_C0005G0029 [candidate division TM6 bacterium GW2011_GWF2_28_16]|nr:MAG: hypothetical protein SZ59_C0005G0029 [candidate division TM6 bacterium GW2011_GWF2_28_16]
MLNNNNKLFIKKFILSLFLFLGVILFFKNSCNTNFPKINSYSQVKELFDHCDKNSLIIFDIDDTLITSQDAFANDVLFPWYFKIIAGIKYPKIIFDKEKIEYIASIVVQNSVRYVFDPDIVNIIKNLQNKNIPVIALSYMKAGTVGIIKNLPEWRANMLNNLDINFTSKYPDIIFKKLPQKYNNYPCLYKGILCTNEESKGLTLGAFLDCYNLNPDKIIFFDDMKDNLVSVKKECQKRKINFMGFQVTGVQLKRPVWNTKRALLQLDFLIEHEQWIPDEVANKIINKEIKMKVQT